MRRTSQKKASQIKDKRSENDEYKNIQRKENNWKKWVRISEINKEKKTNNTDVKEVLFGTFFLGGGGGLHKQRGSLLTLLGRDLHRMERTI